ncbi:MAG: hypothetical protein ABI597_02755 [Gammaproteobacteria bacterium]
MIGSRQEIARLQSDFYRDKYKSTLRILLISICVMVALIAGIIYLVLFRIAPQYYATTPEGQIIHMPSAKTGS